MLKNGGVWHEAIRLLGRGGVCSRVWLGGDISSILKVEDQPFWWVGTHDIVVVNIRTSCELLGSFGFTWVPLYSSETSSVYCERSVLQIVKVFIAAIVRPSWKVMKIPVATLWFLFLSIVYRVASWCASWCALWPGIGRHEVAAT